MEITERPATQKEKRLMVARDVLNQLEDKVFVTGGGTWLSVRPRNSKGSEIIKGMGGALSLRQFNPVAKKHKDDIGCYGCAVGACLLSYAQLYEDVTLKTYGYTWLAFSTSGAFTYMQKELGDGQMALVEIAYERRATVADPAWLTRTKPEERTAAFVFGCRFSDSRKRLIAIMKNIIAHDGDFRPDDLTDKEKEEQQ